MLISIYVESHVGLVFRADSKFQGTICSNGLEDESALFPNRFGLVISCFGQYRKCSDGNRFSGAR